MFRSWTFARQLAFGFSLAGLTLLIIVVTAYRSTGVLIENNGWVTHTQQVRTALADFLSAVKDAETGQRGFVITGDETYLEPYTRASAELEPALGRLERLTADNPDQRQRVDAMRTAMEKRLAALRAGIEARRTGGFAAASPTVTDGEGKALMEQLRALVGEADAQEAQLLDERTASASQSAQAAMAIITWGGLIGALVVGLVGFLMTRSLSRQIGAAVGHVQSSSAELHSAATQQASGVKEQVTSMSEINTTISELLATSRQIAESAQRVAQIAEDTTSAAEAGNGTVARASDSIAGIRRQVDLVVNHMLELGRKSQQIGAVLDIVSELAEQTNILSINATIEASGAGEAGKRFAVVADEIRKLADRVAGSAKEIRTLIDDVRSSVNTTVMATETGSKAVESGAREFGAVADVFQQIAGLVVTTTEAAREIELSTKQQATAVEQVNIAIASVAQATRETESSAGQTIQTASELASTSRDLLRLVQARRVMAA